MCNAGLLCLCVTSTILFGGLERYGEAVKRPGGWDIIVLQRRVEKAGVRGAWGLRVACANEKRGTRELESTLTRSAPHVLSHTLWWSTKLSKEQALWALNPTSRDTKLLSSYPAPHPVSSDFLPGSNNGTKFIKVCEGNRVGSRERFRALNAVFTLPPNCEAVYYETQGFLTPGRK